MTAPLYVKQVYLFYFKYGKLTKDGQLCQDCNKINCGRRDHIRKQVLLLEENFIGLLNKRGIEVDIK